MNDVRIEFNSLDLAAIDSLAIAMVRHLPCPLVIGLTGTLGAGKTTLVQRLAAAAGIDPGDVTSPTFTLLQSHHGSIVIHHLDAYRVGDEEEFLQLGVEELFEDSQSWTIIEWADRVREVLPANTLWIRMDHGEGQTTRDVQFQSTQTDLIVPLASMQADFQASRF